MSVAAWHSPVGVDQSLPAPRVIRPSNDAPWMSDPELRSLARAIVEVRNAGQDDSLLLDQRLRRLRQLLEQHRPTEQPLELGGLLVKRRTCEVFVNGAEIQLSPLEWRILLTLLDADGRLVSARLLAREGWDLDEPAGCKVPPYVKQGVLHLRDNLRDAGWDTSRLATVISRGYLLDLEGLKP